MWKTRVEARTTNVISPTAWVTLRQPAAILVAKNECNHGRSRFSCGNHVYFLCLQKRRLPLSHVPASFTPRSTILGKRSRERRRDRRHHATVRHVTPRAEPTEHDTQNTTPFYGGVYRRGQAGGWGL
ncbi:hypothetical protein NDU88_000679 [Pleurodeles waltl]|uniref:Uncharacterized protein n=1 Tax=Pleurodeles waltl TaxID=8319 RepID=A0AAV7LAU5_PLEWA|nr:hypothetical protein NDU88_000679 [Pleurodeles waltl]